MQDCGCGTCGEEWGKVSKFSMELISGLDSQLVNADVDDTHLSAFSKNVCQLTASKWRSDACLPTPCLPGRLTAHHSCLPAALSTPVLLLPNFWSACRSAFLRLPFVLQ